MALRLSWQGWFKTVEWKNVCSSPLARAPKLQLAVEQPLTGGCWNPPKKKRPHIQRQRRSCNHDKTKSHTHKVDDSQTREKYQRSSPTVMKVLRPTSGFTAWRSIKGTKSPREYNLGQLDLITGLAKTDTPFLEGTDIPWSSSYQDPGKKSSDPTGDWTRPTCQCWRVSCGGMSQQWLATGTAALASAVLRDTPWHEPS